MSGFAASVVLGELDDFIEPSQACVNPLFASEVNEAAKDARDGRAKVALDSSIYAGLPEPTVRPDLIKATSNKTAKVSLNDCLACSGCVTSAETVLITQQSTKELLSQLGDRRHAVRVVSVSPQARASLAAHFGLSAMATHRRLVTLFKSLGADLVFDIATASDVALVEARAEFVRRFRRRRVHGWERPPTTVAVSSSSVQYMSDSEDDADEDSDERAESKHGDATAAEAPASRAPRVEAAPVHKRADHTALPMLASACPGWVCFAEKTHPESIPYISTAKSPQQVMGSLVKDWFAPARGVKAADVYHATLMPCFDKKLEASRKDFEEEVSRTKAVDTVVTSGEVLEMLEERGIDFAGLEEAPLAGADADPFTGLTPDGSRLTGAVLSNAASGGFLEHIFRFAARELFGVVVEGPLQFKKGRNADMREVALEVDGKAVLRFAIAYGFRNIQSVIRRMKRGKCPYHFVELMACPSGCVNGGGQIRPADPLAVSDRLALVEAAFYDRELREPEANPRVHAIYKAIGAAEPCTERALDLFHTGYHAVPKLKNPLTIRW